MKQMTHRLLIMQCFILVPQAAFIVLSGLTIISRIWGRVSVAPQRA